MHFFSELGAWDVFNPATAFINFFAYMGWAWDLKKPTPEMIAARMKTKGDISQYTYQRNNMHSLYEWTTGIISLTGPWIIARFGLALLAK